MTTAHAGCNCDKYNPNCRCYEETTMRDTMESDAGEELVERVAAGMTQTLMHYAAAVASYGLYSDEASDWARRIAKDALAALPVPGDTTSDAPEGTIHIGSAEIRPFNDPIRAHDAAPPAEETVERVAEALRPITDSWVGTDKDTWSPTAGRRFRHELARAALAAMPAPGDTLEGLLGDAWEIAQARRDDSGRWIVAVWRLPYSPRQLIRDGAYGAGPTIADAVRMAIEAAGGGQ